MPGVMKLMGGAWDGRSIEAYDVSPPEHARFTVNLGRVAVYARRRSDEADGRPWLAEYWFFGEKDLPIPRGAFDESAEAKPRLDVICKGQALASVMRIVAGSSYEMGQYGVPNPEIGCILSARFHHIGAAQSVHIALEGMMKHEVGILGVLYSALSREAMPGTLNVSAVRQANMYDALAFIAEHASAEECLQLAEFADRRRAELSAL